MKLSVNGQLTDAKDRINNDRGVFSITPTSAVNISVFSTAYKDIGKLFTIELPRTDAYYCITKDGDVDVATVEYGKTLSFRVVLSPDYDMSTIYAYANTDELTPDDYGYYDIEAKYNKETKQVEIVDGNGKIGIQGNVTISVKGAISNDRVNTASNLVSFIQEIFTIIKSIFEYFKDIFAGLGSLGGAIS